MGGWVGRMGGMAGMIHSQGGVRKAPATCCCFLNSSLLPSTHPSLRRWWWRSIMCGGSTALFIYGELPVPVGKLAGPSPSAAPLLCCPACLPPGCAPAPAN